MNPLLYDIIQYGANPCILNTVCKSWKEEIENIDNEIVCRIQYKMPTMSITRIILMLIDSKQIDMLYIAIHYTSRPIVDWNIMSYLIEDRDVGNILLQRCRNIHTYEMGRRLGIPTTISNKDRFLLLSVLKRESSTYHYKSLSDIISAGYLDAFVIIKDKIDTDEFIDILSVALSILIKENKPYNPYILQMIYNDDALVSCIPYIIQSGIYSIDHLYTWISMDTYVKGINMIPCDIMHQLGKNILSIICKNIFICKNYLDVYDKRKTYNIRVLQYMYMYSNSNNIRDRIRTIILNNDMGEYIMV